MSTAEIEQVKARVIDVAAPKIMAAIRRKFPDALVERDGDSIVVHGQAAIDAEFRSRNPWVVATAREALK